MRIYRHPLTWKNYEQILKDEERAEERADRLAEELPEHVTVREEYVKCGKPNCYSCPHGPYFYAYWKEKGRLKKRYIGIDLPYTFD